MGSAGTEAPMLGMQTRDAPTLPRQLALYSLPMQPALTCPTSQLSGGEVSELGVAEYRLQPPVAGL